MLSWTPAACWSGCLPGLGFQGGPTVGSQIPPTRTAPKQKADRRLQQTIAAIQTTPGICCMMGNSLASYHVNWCPWLRPPCFLSAGFSHNPLETQELSMSSHPFFFLQQPSTWFVSLSFFLLPLPPHIRRLWRLSESTVTGKWLAFNHSPVVGDVWLKRWLRGKARLGRVSS